MIEINFFEKKPPNYSRLLIIAIFIIGLILIGVYLLVTSNQLTNQSEANLNQINDQQPIINELESIQAYSNQLNQLSNELETLREHQYQTVFLYETILDQLPDSEVLLIENYNFSINDGLKLTLQLVSLEQVAKLDRAILDLPFVASVELTSVNLINESEEQYIIDLEVEIDRDQLQEVAAND